MNDLQRTPEWHAARLGKMTGSRIDQATAKLKGGGWGASRANYKADLVNERLTGVPTEHFISKPMQDGIDREPDAIVNYEFARNVVVHLVGFIDHPRIPMSGCSPDGLVLGADELVVGTVSIKCGILATHQAMLKGTAIDGAYIKQLQWEMACLPHVRWCDFVSYNPLMPTDLQIDIRRIERDDKLIAKLEAEAEEFLREVTADHCWMLDLAARRRYGQTASSSPDGTVMAQLQASVEALGA